MTRAKDVFLDALERPAVERQAFVDAACGDDAALRQSVERLLAAHEGSEGIFGGKETRQWSTRLQKGDRIAAYELVEQVGEGGFATVWRAQQHEPVQRAVALKILKAGMDTAQVVSRFEAEHQALAMMDHPGIAMVFDGGATEFGRPWFAMEFVSGVAMTDYCEQRQLGKRARLELFLQVCRAVQHAHTKGVIHRDLKPSNILVGEVDGRALPKVIDFGIAKAIEQQLSDRSIVTTEGQVIGTPAYMSPEQLDESMPVDTRCDVYALGVLLYELLAGVRPFDDETLQGLGLAEMLRVIREVEPPRPSARDSRMLSARELRGDLDWIVMRCLEKDRDRRYDSADVLANEIERHLAGEPVLAGPPDLAYRTRKFVGRHQVALAVAATIAVLLVVGLAVSLSQMFRAQEAEARTKVELGKFDEINRFYEGILTGVDPAVAKTEDTALLRRLLGDASARAEQEFAAQPEVEAVVRRAIGLAYLKLGSNESAEPHLRRAFELRRARLANGDVQLSESRQELAVVLGEREQWDEAEQLQRQAAEAFEQTLGAADARTVKAFGILGAILRRRGQLDEAEQLLREQEANALASLGEAHDETITILNNLAGVLKERGNLEEAAERTARALRLQLATQGELHPEALMSLNNHAEILWSQDRKEAAVKVLQAALELKRKVFDEDHPSLLVALNNIGDSLRQLGRYEAAVPFFDEALELVDRTGQGQTPKAIKLLFNYAKLLARADDREGAARTYGECAKRSARLFGPVSRMTSVCQGAQGWQLVELGRPEEAEPLLAAALQWGLDNVADGDPLTAMNRIRMGVCQRDLGHRERAVALLQKGAAFGEKGLETWHPIAVAALKTLGK